MDTWNLIVLIWFCGRSCYHCLGENEVSEIKVRLVGGRSIFKGRVEVYYNNTWGTVCDDNFGILDAQVFCYMLGYERFGAKAKHGAYFGEGNKTIWLDDLQCNGTEISVDQCGKNRGLWGSHNCRPTEDAGIVCQPKIRLTGGKTKYEGRVEINYFSIWRTVCHDNFSNADAQVFCSMLEYERYGAEVFSGNISFGNSNGHVLPGSINCSGNETSISDCNSTKSDPINCSNDTGVAIKCYPKYDVRLIGGLVEYEGRVEINDSGNWRMVCSDSFTNGDAQVLCHALGFPREGAIPYENAYFGQGSGDTWFGNMGCVGHELSIVICKNKLSGFKNCSHRLDAGIRCKPKVRLVDGKTENVGRVEVYHSGIWGTVCDDNFDSLNVQVLCFMLGYDRNGSGVFYAEYPTPGNGTIWLDSLDCTGQETSIDKCDKNIWGVHNCRHHEDVGIKCRTKSGCTALSMPQNGNYSNTSCTSNLSPVGTHCILICHDGFKPLSENITTCFGTGLWNKSDIFMTCIGVDECEDGSHLCSQNCRNTEGSYDCYCNEGFIIGEDNTTCNDINECNTDSGGCSHTCTNMIGSFVCNCFDGYSLENDSISCIDLNECNIRNGDCNQICINEDGSYTCDCKTGYYMTLDNLTCADDNECTRNNGGCDQVCVNTDGKFYCECKVGYSMNNDTEICEDINECEVDNGICDHNCRNTKGSFVCFCMQGYRFLDDNTTCVDINECMEGNGGCDHECRNENGTFSCSCYKGYLLQSDNKSCDDIDECSIDNGGCSHTCTNKIGSFVCSCFDGYSLEIDSISCIDLNECNIRNGDCNQKCINENGSYKCDCNSGYYMTSDNLTCADDNECNRNNGGCDQVCVNTDGKFYCECNVGYSMNNDTDLCEDINECEVDNGICDHNCRNTNGSFVCSCMQGYRLLDDNTTCLDINECMDGNGGCDHECRNENGTFLCSCYKGYLLQSDNKSCDDIDECSIDNGGCSHACTNKIGSFVCNCFDGYSIENDSISCIDLNECNIRNGDCNQICVNEDGSYRCDCYSGYYMTSDNLTCENECNRNNGGCDHECSNENGTFSCSCYRGYLLQSNNKSCDDINECSTNNGECEHVCINTKGAHECSCKTGFILEHDTYSCKDKNECNYRNGGCEQICVNMIGSFTCQCEKGYSLQGDNYSCTDINECDLSNGNCEQMCTNNQGSFSCACKDGFLLDEKGFVCEDIIECDIDNGGCQQLCHNLEGSFACSCTNGYVLNKNDITCKNVSGRSQSSYLRVKIGISVVKNLKDPTIYNYVREHLGISLMKYFEDYATLKISIAVQQILTIEEHMETVEEDTIIVGFTVIYEKETSLLDRENILQGILNFNKSKLLLYDGNSIPAVLVNAAPVISPTNMLVTLSENTSVGALLGVFSVRDNDDDIRGDIHVYSQDKPEEISLGQVTDNKVQIVLAGSVDADKYQRRAEAKLGPVVNFTVVVKDKPGSKAIANVTLTINDINDNAPVCSPGKLTVKMPRDETIGTSIYNLNTICIDNDYYYNRIDFFIADDTCKAFSINPSGSIFLKSAILEEYPSCVVSIKVTDQDNNNFHTKLIVLVKFKECPADLDYRNKEWKRGSPGKYTFSTCPDGYKGEVKRFCNLNAEYLEPVYNCTNAAISKIMEKVFKEDTNVSSVLNDLVNVTAPSTTNNNSLLLGDLETVNKVMSKITEVIEVNEDNVNNVADFFVETANNILDETTTASWSSKINETGSGADSVLENLDRFTEKISNVSTTAGEIKVAKSNLFLKVGSTNACDGTEMQFPDRRDSDVPKWAEKTLDKIQITCRENSKSYSSVMYRNLSKILPSTLVGNSTNRGEKLNAPVMSFSYFPKVGGNLERPVEITFQLYDGFLERPLCSFWKKGKGSEGGWSTNGCWLVKFDKKTKTVVCKCNHLTNFAVLMSPSSAKIDHPALSAISLVGCILSLICLFVTIVIHAYFWRVLKSDKTVLNMHLACVLFVAYIIFLAGVNQTENKGACTAIAVFLHLAYLIVFFVMLSEGLLLAKTVIYPFNTRKPAIPLLIASYAIPVIIVAISMGSVAMDGYGDENSCWLSAKSDLIWAFIVPALIVMLINMAIIILVIRAMFGTSALSKKSRNEKAVAGARSIAILMPIMGITWVLGVFSVNEDTVVFQYLFALFNSTQGVLIFVFHCAMNKKIQKAFRKQRSKWMSLRSYTIEKSMSNSMASSSMKSTRLDDGKESIM